MNIHWIIRDEHIGSVFFDDIASAFILPLMYAKFGTHTELEVTSKLISFINNEALSYLTKDQGIVYKSSSNPALWNSGLHSNISPGAAVGPGWLYDFNDLNSVSNTSPSNIHNEISLESSPLKVFAFVDYYRYTM